MEKLKRIIESNAPVARVVEAITTGRVPVDGDQIRFLKDNAPFSRGDTADIVSAVVTGDNSETYTLSLEGQTGEQATITFSKADVDDQFEYVYGGSSS